VDEKDLIARIDTALPLAKQVASHKVLDIEDLSALFGLDMDVGAEPLTTGGDPPAAPRKPVRARKTTRPDPSGDRRQAVTTGTRLAKQVQAGKHATIKGVAAGEPLPRSPVQPKDPTKEHVATKTVTTKPARKMRATT
jgi:hypothetical protein